MTMMTTTRSHQLRLFSKSKAKIIAKYIIIQIVPELEVVR